jgi:hypothetical protein
VLEHKELLFRGDLRLMIPLSGIDEARADAGRLVIVFGGRSAALEIGAGLAEKWAKRITSPPSRVDKLGVKAGMRIALVRNGRRDAGRGHRRERRAARDECEEQGARHDFLRRPCARAISPGSRRSLAGSTGRRHLADSRQGPRRADQRAESMAAGKKAGLVDVKVVSYSDTHSAEKYVIPVARRRAPARSR